MVNKSDAGSSALEASTFDGRMPAGSGDLAIETHGIEPVPEDNRYGGARAAVHRVVRPEHDHDRRVHRHAGDRARPGLLARPARHGHRHGARLAAGRLPVDLGPRTGTGQLPASRMAFGGAVVLPGHRPVALLDRLGRRWSACSAARRWRPAAHPVLGRVLIVLALQGVLGIFGYELIHRRRGRDDRRAHRHVRGARRQAAQRAPGRDGAHRPPAPTWPARSSSRSRSR